MTLGAPEQPLRVAIIGSGPSAFYAAERLLKQAEIVVSIDMFERLVSPHGLVRGGVAPDHAKIKGVTKVYDRIAALPGFRYFGNVEFGRDITHEDIVRHYHQVIYATGAQTDRRMGIPGEDLPGSHAATEFVGWYNAHPDYRHLHFDLSQKAAAVIGNGNVAMDVARILGSSIEELACTDIADHALAALARSEVRDIYVLGRRGPAQAAFTNPEIRELGELDGADIIVHPKDVELDLLSSRALLANNDRTAEQNVQVLHRYAHQPPKGKPRRIHMRFLVSPVELIGSERVEAIRVVKNVLFQAEDGALRPRPTGETEIIPVGLVFRSIGYMGVPLPGVPFDPAAGVIPNENGRVIDPERGEPLTGEYAVGWIKRGPIGVIGTNKPDAVETVHMMMEDLQAGRTLCPAAPQPEAVNLLLAERGVRSVSYEEWLLIDQLERELGAAQNRPRIKFDSSAAMLRALDALKASSDLAAD